MPSLLDYRRRIRSVKNTQQITKAMKMVAAAKLRRVQDRAVAARPYSTILEKMLANVVAASAGDDSVAGEPLLEVRPEERIQAVLLTSDRGLAGPFNTNLLKTGQKFATDHGRDSVIEWELVGRKGRDYWRKRHAKTSGELLGVAEYARYADAQALARKLVERYRHAEVDAVYLIFSEFRSVMSQAPVVRRILPVTAPDSQGAGQTGTTDYLFEQPAGELLRTLLPQYVEVQVYRAMLESAASEHAARMTAMDAASRNSSEVIERLTLYMNRVRQASITKEIIEVVSGAAAAQG